jgi:3-oxoacyl-[acyl-carrier protein] reductase
MPGKLDDKIALVTGAGRGIGKAISIALGSEGATVVLAARDMDKLEQAALEVDKAGGKPVIATVELTDENSIKTLAAKTAGIAERLDVLVNCAGVTHAALLEKTETADWDRCMNVNARGAFLVCRETIPLLRNSSQGCIINISSVVGVKGYPNQSAYTASKHAMRGMSISLAEELMPDNIRVHVICPGGVNTEMVSRVRPDIDASELIGPEEIAEVASYLATHKGNAVMDEIHLRRVTSSPWF